MFLIELLGESNDPKKKKERRDNLNVVEERVVCL